MVRARRDVPPLEAAALRTFVAASTVDPDHVLIDDDTWNDLDMDAVAERLDRSISLPGRMALRRMLRTPSTSEAVLLERERLVRLLEQDRALAEALRHHLARLDRNVSAGDPVPLLWGETPTPPRFGWIYPLLALLAAVSVAAAVAIGKISILAPMVVLSLNGAVHFHARSWWHHELEALRFLGTMLAVGRRVSALKHEGIREHRQRLATAVREASPLARRIAWISSGAVWGVLYEYFNVFLLLELQALRRILRQLPGLLPSLRKVFLTLGELDALLGVACWRGERTGWCQPDLHDGPAALVIEEGTHPLLDDPIPNSISLSTRGALITGANMSGKSTFLRVVGINAVLAQSIGTCTARRYRASRLRVLSSMRSADDVIRGKSRYMVEAERLHTLVRQAGSEPSTLCLIDELLSGTNAVERLAASAAILEHLRQAGALVVAATHDLELAEQLADSYDRYNFADDFAEHDLRFDHRIRVGLATTRNAIQLLERLGYPQDLLDRARRRL